MPVRGHLTGLPESVELLARALEQASIATVCVVVRGFAHVASQLRLPRVLVTPHLMGRTMGPVGDRHRQQEVVETALRLLSDGSGPQTRRHL